MENFAQICNYLPSLDHIICFKPVYKLVDRSIDYFVCIPDSSAHEIHSHSNKLRSHQTAHFALRPIFVSKENITI